MAAVVTSAEENAGCGPPLRQGGEGCHSERSEESRSDYVQDSARFLVVRQ
jgi:hypothetical protein